MPARTLTTLLLTLWVWLPTARSMAAEHGGDLAVRYCKQRSGTTLTGGDFSNVTFGRVRPQQLRRRIGPEAPDPFAEEFHRVVGREPAAYRSEQPFRAVVSLGGRPYGLVLDAAAADGGYDLLRFDTNRNGDLTDDPEVRAEEDIASFQSGKVTWYRFPRVELTIDVDGRLAEYAFFLTCCVQKQEGASHAVVELRSAAYREGVVELEGRERRVVVVDHDSNGRFDDRIAVSDRLFRSNAGHQQRIALVAEDLYLPDGSGNYDAGDLLFIDPEVDRAFSTRSPDPESRDDAHWVAPLISVDGAFFDLEITPAGDRITIAPAAIPLGGVENSNAPWRATILGRDGVLRIGSRTSDPVALPAGEWRLLSCTIDRTPAPRERPKKKTLWSLIAGDGDEPQPTQVSARASAAAPPITVAPGETSHLSFGPPYRGVVTARPGRTQGTANLRLAIVGSAGEECTGLRVDGKRPRDPAFAITTPAGEVVAEDRFEYG